MSARVVWWGFLTFSLLISKTFSWKHRERNCSNCDSLKEISFVLIPEEKFLNILCVFQKVLSYYGRNEVLFAFSLLYYKMFFISKHPDAAYHFTRALKQASKGPRSNIVMCPRWRRKPEHIKGQRFAKGSSRRDQQLVKELSLLANSLWDWPSNNLSRFQDSSQSTARALTFSASFVYS